MWPAQPLYSGWNRMGERVAEGSVALDLMFEPSPAPAATEALGWLVSSPL